MDDGEFVAPKDGGAMGHGENARVDEAFECSWPGFARPNRRLRPINPVSAERSVRCGERRSPVLVLEMLLVHIKDGQPRRCELVEIFHGAG